MMRIAYCDDERIQSIFLKQIITEYEKLNHIRCKITVYGSAEEMLFENPESFPFDFILLDIELDRMNGIELAKNIRKADQKVIIAFLSNSKEYVFAGYEVAAVRYLVKPITMEQLFPLLDMVKQAKPDQKEYIIVGGTGEKIKLYLEDIIYVEALAHYVSIHTMKESFEFKMSLKEVAEKLESNFIFTHRSFLVNLEYIERITKTECILRGNHRVPVSRSSYKQVNQSFITYYKGGFLC